MRSFKSVLGLLAALLALNITPLTSPAAEAEAGFRVLLFSKTLGYRHDSIMDGIKALHELGGKEGFAVDATEDSGAFTATNLTRYKAVVFLSATGDVLDSTQETAFKNYVLNGGGFAAIHGAIFGPLACEDQWGWYGEVFCCAFANHSAVVPASVDIEDAKHPSTAGLPARWQRTDEWYNYTGTPRGSARVLATVDESTYSGGRMGKDHPIAWCRRVGTGRMWFTAMGHTESSFSEPHFLQHLLGGIRYVSGTQPADDTPNRRPAGAFIWKQEAGSVALLQGAQAVWQFNFGTNATKPFFHPLALPGGPVLTWDKPADHRWHRALWFSWKFINGVNYWEEDPKTGTASGRTVWQEPQIETRPDSSARIVMNLAYHPATNVQTVLTERRVIDISAPDTNGVYHQDWTMTFTAGSDDVRLDRTPLPGEPGGQAWGGYAGLSVRFAQGIKDPQAISSREPVTFTGGRYRGTAAAMEYSGAFEGREAGIAILDSPVNLNSPSPWYVINDGAMNFFTPAVICNQPHTLKAGRQMTLRYRVVVHPGRWDAGQLRQAAERFASGQPAK